MRQLIGPLVEFAGHVVGRQRAAMRMGVEQEDQLHQDSRGVGLLGSKVEHRHDVALIVTARRESDPGGQRALVREDHVTEEEHNFNRERGERDPKSTPQKPPKSTEGGDRPGGGFPKT